MQIINITPFQFACLAGKVNFPKNSLTFIIKGTFDLRPDKSVSISEKQLFPTGDEFYPEDEDMIGGPYYPSDFAYFKPKADLLLVGKCYAPQGKKVYSSTVKFQVESKVKTLNIYGRRFWKQDISGAVASSPEPFSEMDLRYENSFGGEGFETNPVGKGIKRIENEQSEKIYPLPNILRPGEQISSPAVKLEPSGFGPLNQAWKQRFSKLGSYKGNYLKERWPWFSKDFDWSFFNSAPSDMQINGYLKGNERLYFENFHPVYSQYHSRLPGLRIRCFVNEIDEKAGKVFKEVKLNIDTLWVDMGNEKLVLVWRGVSDIMTEDYEELQHTLIVAENAEEMPQTIDFYRVLLEKALIEPEEEPFQEEPFAADNAEDIEMEKEITLAEERTRQSLIQAGIDPDNLPQQTEEQKRKEAELLKEIGFEEETEVVKLTREVFIERNNRKESFSGEDLTGVDLSELNLQGLNAQDAVLTGISLKNCDLSKANLAGANLSGTDLSGAKLINAFIKDADLTNAILVNADLTCAEIEGAVFEKAKMNNAALNGVKGKNSFFSGADLTGANLLKSDLHGSDFSKSLINKSNFTGSNLREASFEGASGIQIDMSQTDLTMLKASGGCNFTQAKFQKSKGLESIWEKAILNEADFSFSEMEGANFSSASLERANLTGSNMKFVKFTKANLTNAIVKDMNLFQGSFEKANLTKADCSRSNFYGVEFLDSKIADTKFLFTNLKMTKLAGK